DGVLREFAGFGRVVEDQLGDETAATLRITSSFHIGLDPEHRQEPATLQDRQRLRALRGRMYRQERLGCDGSPQPNAPYDRLEQLWTVVSEETPGGRVDIPRLISTTRSQCEREQNELAVITTTNLQWDTAGNVTQVVDMA